jgi:hypothetical protein
VGEDFSILCMRVIVLEKRTLPVKILKGQSQTSRDTFELHPWAKTNLAARRAHHWCLVIDGSGGVFAYCGIALREASQNLRKIRDAPHRDTGERILDRARKGRIH